jgi:thioredoxin reductase (NADPH)
VLSSTVQVRTNANVTRLVGDHGLEALEVEDVKTHETATLPAQAVVAALGFVADLGPIQTWGLEVHKRHIVVDSATRTNLPRVFAAGDVTDYPGKVRLIAVGFGEAATAVNNAAVAINPGAHLFPGHSSEG